MLWMLPTRPLMTIEHGTTMSPTDVTLAEKAAFLSRPNAFPEKTPSVTILETHMSLVFVTNHHAWKMKKPVSFSKLDFSSLDKREHCCREEIRLNRHLAPDVYLDVVPLTLDNRGNLSLNGTGQTIEWLVKMRRLPLEATLHYKLKHNSVVPQESQSIGITLGRFFSEARHIDMEPEDYCHRFRKEIETGFSNIRKLDIKLPPEIFADLQKILSAALNNEKMVSLLHQRIKERRIVEGHGDLRPEHIYLTPEPIIIDCIEFNAKLRMQDPATELSFLAMECARLGHKEVGEQIFSAYTHETDDKPPQALKNFYAAYSAVLRAQLTILHLQNDGRGDPVKWTRKTNAYLTIALTYAKRLDREI